MEKSVNSYLESLISQCCDYTLTPAESRRASRDKPGYIMDKLTRKKFRRKIGEETRKSTADKINLRVKANQPIHLVIPFGGYKHFWNPSHPEPDWAELFHFKWMTEYMAPILAVYEPGVILEYISEDLILPRMNNYPEEALEEYSTGFRKLIEWYQQFTPNNLDIRYWRISEKHDKKKLIEEVEKLLPERLKAHASQPPERQQQEIHRSVRSICWHGRQDLSNLSEKEKEARIIESRLIELAFYDIEASPEFIGDYYWNDSKICICFSFGLSHDNDEFGDLTIQSAHGSSVDFWIGRGVVKKNNDKYYATILSKQQFENAKTKIVPISQSLDIPGKNFEAIQVAE